MSGWNHHKHPKHPIHMRAPHLLLGRPRHDKNLLPVLKRGLFRGQSNMATHLVRKAVDRTQDLKVVTEFRQKLRMAEDLISKLGFSMREIQTLRRRSKETKSESTSSVLLPFKA
jgi:hypothetical protein